MFKQENRYVSRQVNEAVSIQLQILMWSMIDSLKGKKQLDYLQIFRLKVKGDRVLIEHDMKIYVIDSVDYSTMIFAEEY